MDSLSLSLADPRTNNGLSCTYVLEMVVFAQTTDLVPTNTDELGVLPAFRYAAYRTRQHMLDLKRGFTVHSPGVVWFSMLWIPGTRPRMKRAAQSFMALSSPDLDARIEKDVTAAWRKGAQMNTNEQSITTDKDC